MAQIDIAEARPAGQSRPAQLELASRICRSRPTRFSPGRRRPLEALKWIGGAIGWRSRRRFSKLLLADRRSTYSCSLRGRPCRSLAPGWVLQIWAAQHRALIFLVAGGLHLWLLPASRPRRKDIEVRSQSDLARSDKATFTFRDQVHDNMFWTLASGVTFWTALRGVLIFWSASNGWVPLTSIRRAAPVWFGGRGSS